MKKVVLSLLLFAHVTLSADLGVWGKVYPVAEQNMLTFIESQLTAMTSDGTLKEDEIKNRVMKNVNRPPPVEGLRTVEEDSQHVIDPTFVVNETLTDPQGRVFAKKGDRVNPLLFVPFQQKLYFIDADDARQIQWIKSQHPGFGDKIILVKGNIKEANDALHTRIYFDQYGQLVDKFKISGVPARVSLHQNKPQFLVETFALKNACTQSISNCSQETRVSAP